MNYESYVDNYNDFKPVVIWSDEMKELFHTLYINPPETSADALFRHLKTIFERFLIEMQDEKDKTKTRLDSLEDRIAQLESGNQ